MPSIAELYASLGMRTNRTEFARARSELGGFVKSTDREFKGLGARISASIGNGLKSIRSDLNSGLVKRVGIGALGAGLVLAAKDALKFDDALTTLNINSKGAMGAMAEVRRQIIDVSRATGVAKEEVLRGAASFVALTGNGKEAASAMELLAKVQKAAQASTEDVAGAAAAMSQQFGIGADEFEKGFSILIAGGKAGAIELKQMAELSAELAAQFRRFSGGTGVGGLAQMSAAFQLIAQNFGGSADKAATGMRALLNSFTSDRTIKALQELGVEVFKIGKDGTATLKEFPEIFDAMSRTAIVKDPRLLTKVFESTEARTAADAILKNVRGYKDLAAATLNATDVVEDYNERQRSASARTEKSFNDIKLAIAEVFTPERLQGFADILGTIVESAHRLVMTLEAVSDWYKRNHGDTSEPGSEESKLTDQELDDEIENSRTRWGQLTTSPNKIARLKDERKRRDTATMIARATLAASQSVAIANWAAGGSKGPMPDFGLHRRRRFGAPTVPGGRGAGGSPNINLGGVQVTVNAKTDADAEQIGNMVTRKIRQAWDAQARDIAAAADK